MTPLTHHVSPLVSSADSALCCLSWQGDMWSRGQRLPLLCWVFVLKLKLVLFNPWNQLTPFTQSDFAFRRIAANTHASKHHLLFIVFGTCCFVYDEIISCFILLPCFSLFFIPGIFNSTCAPFPSFFVSSVFDLPVSHPPIFTAHLLCSIHQWADCPAAAVKPSSCLRVSVSWFPCEFLLIPSSSKLISPPWPFGLYLDLVCLARWLPRRVWPHPGLKNSIVVL